MAEPTSKIEPAGSFHGQEAGSSGSSARRKAVSRARPRPEREPAISDTAASEVSEETDEHKLDTVA